MKGESLLAKECRIERNSLFAMMNHNDRLIFSLTMIKELRIEDDRLQTPLRVSLRYGTSPQVLN